MKSVLKRTAAAFSFLILIALCAAAQQSTEAAKKLDSGYVLGPDDQRVPVGGIHRAQSLHQAADVRADAKVADSPGVGNDVQRRHSQARTGSSFHL